MLGHRHSVFYCIWTRKYVGLIAASSHPTTSGEAALENSQHSYTRRQWWEEMKPLHFRINLSEVYPTLGLEFHQIKDVFYCLNQFELGLLLFALKTLIFLSCQKKSPDTSYNYHQIKSICRIKETSKHFLYPKVAPSKLPSPFPHTTSRGVWMPIDAVGLSPRPRLGFCVELTVWGLNLRTRREVNPTCPVERKIAVSEHLTNNIHPWFTSSHILKEKKEKENPKLVQHTFSTGKCFITTSE